MIRDFQEYTVGAEITADVCIVGAGAAGITIAREFAGSGHTVVLLESGGMRPEPETQRLYDSKLVGLPHRGITESRARIFGGTTTLWGGQALRFAEFDFKPRPWVRYSGWPIGLRELEPYYSRAEAVLQLGKRLSYGELCASFGVAPPAFDPEMLAMECSQWSPQPNLGAAYGTELRAAADVVVLLHANVTNILTNEAADRVLSIELKTLNGRTGNVRARCYVICCGAIETARLLLVSNRIEPNGLGNSHDLVGRFFQDHLSVTYGELVPKSRSRLQDLFESFLSSGLKYAPKIFLKEEFQKERRLLSILGNVTLQAADSSVVAIKEVYNAVKRRQVAEIGRALRSIAAHPAEPVRMAARFYFKQRIGTPARGPVILGAECESAPNPDSRLTLSTELDSLAMPRLRLDWKIDELEHATLLAFADILAAELERTRLGTFDRLQLGPLKDPARWTSVVNDNAHHIGTTRMHDSPTLGVVDARCRVHGVGNLYIASSSVFPTSARSNPTLTLLALSLRVADELKQSLAA
jgi:choline dehydrogenase-like flavoprotein